MRLVRVGTNVWVDPDCVLAVSGFNKDIPVALLIVRECGEAQSVTTDWSVDQVIKAVNA